MNPKFTRLYDMALKDLTENLLPWWMEKTVDHECGGFYGQVDDHDRPIADGTKFITLNARLVWTFASAYRVLAMRAPWKWRSGPTPTSSNTSTTRSTAATSPAWTARDG